MDDDRMCPACHQSVLPDDRAAVPATEVVHDQDVGGAPVGVAAGPTVWFHGDHWPGDSGHYRRST